MTQRLALGLSGGGDSVALLHALRATYPGVELHALIVDHALRKGSRAEAEHAAGWAQALGAHSTILTWDGPRAGQGHARQARHRLLAEACGEKDIPLLCLAHTLEDRVETLRMRASRPGGAGRLTGPAMYDPSPVWPQGLGVTLARPFLALRRQQLRAYLKALGQDWIEDPSNTDPRYERVRLRQDTWPEGDAREVELLALSDTALAQRTDLRRNALRLLPRLAEITAWGGAKLISPTSVAQAEPDFARCLVEALMLAVSGQSESPTPQQIDQIYTALLEGRAVTVAGVALTAKGVMGRDPGAVLDRADGVKGLQARVLEAGQKALFDGRWIVHAKARVEIAPWGKDFRIAEPVPSALRPSLLAVTAPETGKLLALPGVNATPRADFVQLAAQRIASRLLPPVVPTWFDAEQCARNVVARLAKWDSKPNITV